MLSEHLQTGLLVEVFEENPFLSRFYEAREVYAFQTQMFFLLSRYRQQQQVPNLRRQGSLISDYMFDKDRLFARLNLAGDEWEVYQQIHSALAGQVEQPDLVIYLQADTDVLMGRIVQRDRPYERAMDREYIEALRQAYEQFVPSIQDVPVLVVDTNQLNFVTNPSDLQRVVDRIRSVLKEGLFQPALPLLDVPLREATLLERGRPLADYQRFLVEQDRTKGFNIDLYFNYLCLSKEMGELSRALTDLWRLEAEQQRQGKSPEQAHRGALNQAREGIEEELADCMSYVLKMANYAGIDLEVAYLEKMKRTQTMEGSSPAS
jgi:deoxyguanosine kinase